MAAPASRSRRRARRPHGGGPDRLPTLAGVIEVAGLIVPGHGVAGGAAPSSPHPGGTIELQRPFFRELGLDLTGCHPATLNVSTHPHEVRIVRPRHHFPAVEWTPLHGPEAFDFITVTVVVEGERVGGWGYRPTAETKAGHFQAPSVLEVIAPFIEGIGYGTAVTLELDPAEVTVVAQADDDPRT